MKRRHVLVAESQVQREVRADAPVVLHEGFVAGLPHVHGREARLPLHDGRQAEQEARQRLPRAVIRRRFSGEAVRVLVVPPVLEEPEHVPLEVPDVAADLERVLPAHPREPVADLQQLVVVLARRAQQRITKRLIALHVEQRETVGIRAAEPHAPDAERTNQISTAGGLALPVQLHPREPDAELVDEARSDRLDEARRHVLQSVVVPGPEAGQVLGREPALTAQRVPAEEECAVLPPVIEAQRALVVLQVLRARVEIVVERTTHAHPHPHAIVRVGQGHELLEHPHRDGVQPLIGNHVARKL